jgi:2,3-bisphosphoglycerate-independent phosphoglycerate mutase
MDRDHRWERVAVAYEAMTGRQASHPLEGEMPAVVTSRSAANAITTYYENPTGNNRIGDEFIVPTQIVDENNTPVGLVQEDDAVFFFNYRGDRPRELTKAFVLSDEDWKQVPRAPFVRGSKFNNLFFATMTNYESTLPVSGVAFEKPNAMKNIFGDVVSKNGLKQLRCAETEKFPHVTFFFNDYREHPFDGETRLLVPSPTDVSTYDQKPEMSAKQVCQGVLEAIRGDDCPDVIVVNFANPDMVGHTGNLQAIIKAVETVDSCSGRIIDAVLRLGGSLIVTADHGNAERTWNPETNSPDTAHTTYDVPLHVIGEGYKELGLREGGVLADIAPTLLEMLGISIPTEMTGQSLLYR